MEDNEAARKAIAELDNGTVDGRTIKVMEAKPREDRPARSGGGFGGNRDGGFKKKMVTNRIGPLATGVFFYPFTTVPGLLLFFYH